jgi:predicted nucleic acid-binding protein
VNLRLRDLIVSKATISVTEPVEMELLNGSRPGRLEAERRLLRRFTWLPFRAAADFEGATAIDRRCRSQGVTPRGTVDCMIAAVALRNDAVVLSADADLVRIARVMGIRLDPASVEPD